MELTNIFELTESSKHVEGKWYPPSHAKEAPEAERSVHSSIHPPQKISSTPDGSGIVQGAKDTTVNLES